MLTELLIGASAREGRAILDAVKKNPEADVESCPGWNTTRLLGHVGGVHRFITRIVAHRATEPLPGESSDKPPTDTDPWGWYQEGLDALLEAYRDFLPDDDPLPPRVELDLLWESICADSRLVYIGAFDATRLLATCTAAIVPNLTRGARPYAVIENVWTHPTSRRDGFGTAVLQRLLDRCWSAGCYKVMLLSNSHNTTAHEFYERNGFDGNAKQGFIMRK